MAKLDAGKTGTETGKALEAAMAQIERAFGKGSIMKLGSRPVQKVPTISSGSLGLDMALGIGGYPRGRIIEIYGPESSGKCLTQDTMLLTASGLMSIEELLAINNLRPDCTNKIQEFSVGLVNENQAIETTSHFTWNNRRPVSRIETSIGLSIRPTDNHPLRVLDTNGFIVWKHTGDLNVGDVLPVMRNTMTFSEIDHATTQEATLLGFLIADGSNHNKKRVAFSNSDPDIIREFSALMDEMYPAKEMRSYPKADSMTIDHHINSTAIRADLALRLGMDYDRAGAKTVPLKIRCSGAVVQKAFLRAYLELECSIEVGKRCLEVVSASRKLLEHVQLMLLNFGFVGTLAEKTVTGYDQSYWRLIYSGVEGYNLTQWLEFTSAERIEQVQSLAAETNGSTNIDSIPHLNLLLRSLYNYAEVKSRESHDLMYDYMKSQPTAGVTYDRLAQIVAFYRDHGTNHPILTYLKDLLDRKLFFTSITKITRESAVPTFDVRMPKTHSFWANALMSHNTTLALHAIAEAQKAGGVCAFIDAEHALDPTYARKLGVDVDNLLISQPDTGEQGLEIADTLARSSSIDVLVIDSVAALVPRAELEGEMGDSHMGLHARLMSQALRKITGSISNSNTLLIFINQIRLKIGVMFGNPETTTGGNALKFYASVRMEIRRTSSIKQGDDVVGNATRVKIVKNKLAPPFRQTEFDILFGEGISQVGEIIDFGVKANIIEKSGAWFSYNSQRIGQGRENAKQFLRDHPAVATEIKAKIMEQAGSIVTLVEDAGDSPSED